MTTPELKPQYPIIKMGMRGSRVKIIQTALNKQGFNIGVDGIFGEETKRAVVEFQKKQGIVQDGVVGSKTLKLLSDIKPFKPILKQEDLEWAADELDVDLASIMAVNFVESKGSGFLKNDNRAVILFERHIMRRRLILKQIPIEPWVSTRPDLVNNIPGGYLGGVSEYDRLENASLIDRTSALESASWGMYQIMGFHWRYLGYNSAVHYVTLMDRSERDQLEAFVKFISMDRRLHNALKERDWNAFAYIYNGPGYRKHKIPYDIRLSEAYREFNSK